MHGSARPDAAQLAPDLSMRWAIRVPIEVWGVAALTVLAAVLRFATIASQSYWLDEALTAHEMHLSFGALVHAIKATETTPPLYFIVSWLWAKVFGVGEAGLRSLSALAGTALIPVMYLCGRDLISRRAGFVAAALAAVNPFLIWYSQEARAYMLLALFCGLSFLFFVRAAGAPSRRNLALWGLCSALAILTHFFAGFLVAAEALWLLYRARNRATITAVLAMAAVQAALLPLAIGDTSHRLNWIGAFPLSIRIKQVPVEFTLGALYQSSIVTYGLLGAAALAAVVIVLLVVGARPAQLRAAGLAAAVAGFVVLAPLVLVLAGHDYFFARNLIPAWIPFALVLAAACTVPRLRLAGAALAAALLAGSVLATIRTNDNVQYQRLNWRGVAAALGTASAPRAIVAYDGVDGAWPLEVYLPRIPWSQQIEHPVSVREVDVVGSTWQTPAARLPPGTQLLSSRVVDQFRVERFTLTPAWTLTPDAIGARAEQLLGPAPPGPAVLLQR